MGTGTIQSMVALSAMQNQWQKKKNDINAGKTSELTSEQRELQMYQSQADDIREGQKPAAIDIKKMQLSRAGMPIRERQTHFYTAGSGAESAH